MEKNEILEIMNKYSFKIVNFDKTTYFNNVILKDYLNKINKNRGNNYELNSLFNTTDKNEIVGFDIAGYLCTHPNPNRFGVAINYNDLPFDEMFVLPENFYVQYNEKIPDIKWDLYINWLCENYNGNMKGNHNDSSRKYGVYNGKVFCNTKYFYCKKIDFDVIFDYIIQKNPKYKLIRIPRDIIKKTHDKVNDDIQKKYITSYSKRNFFENYVEFTPDEVRNNVYVKFIYQEMLNQK